MGKDIYRNRLEAPLNKKVLSFLSSLKEDLWIAEEDIIGTEVHNIMLFEQGILNKNEIKMILISLEKIRNKFLHNQLELDETFEDIHPFIEKCVIDEIGIEVDVPVTVDIHRLIRYPGTLHGKTGFKVQELYIDDLDSFNPLDEVDKRLDPIVFDSEKKITQKLEITELEVPATTLKGETHGPYMKGEIIDVPHHFAVFLLCKGVAKTI